MRFIPSVPDISVVINCFNSQAAIEKHLSQYRVFSSEVLRNIELVIVDDGSETPIFLKKRHIPPSLRVKLARIEDDIKWNMPGARNLGATVATREKILFHDVDHFVTESNFIKLMSLDALPTSKILYTFSRRRLSGESVPSHVNSFLCSRLDFLNSGGYDEDFSGHYGYEDLYFRNMWAKANGIISLLDDVLLVLDLRYATVGLTRDSKRNRETFFKKLHGEEFEKKGSLRFKYSVQEL